MPRREQDSRGAVLLAGLGGDGASAAGLGARVDGCDGLGHKDLHAEALGLLAHLVGQVRAGDALGEAGVVVDALGGSGLAADTTALDDQGVHALAGGVDGGGQSGGSGADDDEIVVGTAGPGVDVQTGGQLGVAGLSQDGTAVVEYDGGDDLTATVELSDGNLGRRLLFDVHPTVGNAVFGKELLGASAIGAPQCAVDGDVGVLDHIRTSLYRRDM